MSVKEREVVLNTTGLIQLAGGIVSLLVLGFLAGAVVGFGIHGGVVPAGMPSVTLATGEAPEMRAVSTPEFCVPAPSDAVPSAIPLRVAEAPPTPFVPLGEKYAVQVGVFGIEANADRFTQGLRARGYDPLVVAMRNRSGQWMQRVHLSVFDSEESALTAARVFTDAEGLPAVVVALREDAP